VTAPPQESQGHRRSGISAGRADAIRALTRAASGTDDPEVESRAADRVIVFSDAVVAIAITLLALALPVPGTTNATTNGQFLDSLRGDWGDYLAFLLSFVIIGGNWSAHRRTFRYVNRLNRLVGALNMIWLLMMILTPFAARLLAAHGGGFGVRFTIYVLIQVIASACFVQMNLQISGENLLRQNAPSAARHPDSSHGLALIVVFLVSVPVAFATGSAWAFALWAAVPVLSRVLRRRMTSGRHAANDADRRTG
jgi:uncharacterized membrane protein